MSGIDPLRVMSEIQMNRRHGHETRFKRLMVGILASAP